MASTRTVKATEVILNSPNDWEDWYTRLKAKAIRAEIWEYMNDEAAPNTASKPPKPEIPTTTDACNRNTRSEGYAAPTMTNLTKEERSILSLLNSQYSNEMTVYRILTSRLFDATEDIPATISRGYNSLIKNYTSARAIL
ncbi:hypothetical protein EG327_000855 [Venturia inaequalis]|uniref:Uncharacterized protein n=1 Tax=Venturia inaequalis TaxID=5025 RepID=A0A8H3U7K9_VENIN|nr:hypothetical protein EG327_000855 [Venturia inaequalis]